MERYDWVTDEMFDDRLAEMVDTMSAAAILAVPGAYAALSEDLNNDVLTALGSERPAQYVATINVPGYLPTDDDPPVFDHPREAWAYLADERERGEDDASEDDDEGYTETRETLAALGTDAHWQRADPDQDREWLASHGLDKDGTGSIVGKTPGYDGDHDLGLAYSVSIVE